VYLGNDQGDIAGLDADGAPAADAVADDDAAGLAVGRHLIDGRLEFLLQQVRPFMQPGFQKFEVDRPCTHLPGGVCFMSTPRTAHPMTTIWLFSLHSFFGSSAPFIAVSFGVACIGLTDFWQLFFVT
jgi:hypothetical protein